MFVLNRGFAEFGLNTHLNEFESFFCQVKGEVLLVGIPALQRNGIYPFRSQYGPANFSPLNLFAPLYTSFPNYRHAHRFTIRILPGECFYIPAYWWISFKTNNEGEYLFVNFKYKSTSRFNDILFNIMSKDKL